VTIKLSQAVPGRLLPVKSSQGLDWASRFILNSLFDQVLQHQNLGREITGRKQARIQSSPGPWPAFIFKYGFLSPGCWRVLRKEENQLSPYIADYIVEGIALLKGAPSQVCLHATHREATLLYLSRGGPGRSRFVTHTQSRPQDESQIHPLKSIGESDRGPWGSDLPLIA